MARKSESKQNRKDAPFDAVTICWDPDDKWYVVRTKPRCEKKFREFCRSRELTAYLPLRRSIRRYRNRAVEFYIPMFSGYAFAQVTPNEVSKLNECRHVAHLLPPAPTMERQLVSELCDIQRLEHAVQKGEIIVRPEIEVGRMIIVRSGPFAGLNGIVTRRRNKVRLTVNVEMVGQSVSLDVDASEVEIDV